MPLGSSIVKLSVEREVLHDVDALDQLRSHRRVDLLFFTTD